MELKYKLEVAEVTDVGCKRYHNEDSTAFNAKLGVLVLADGMGGYKAGEVASAIAVTSIYKAVSAIVAGLPASGVTGGVAGKNNHAALIKNAIIDANSSIYSLSKTEKNFNGMGTTVVAVLAHGDTIYAAHVGDSRLYRLRGDGLQQLTKDHSLVQELVDRGIFSRQEAEEYVPSNLVTRALGLAESVEVDVIEDRLVEGDLLLLCSDGLTDMVRDEEIHLTLGKYSANLQLMADKLVEVAKQHGGDDNISVILTRITNNSGSQAAN